MHYEGLFAAGVLLELRCQVEIFKKKKNRPLCCTSSCACRNYNINVISNRAEVQYCLTDCISGKSLMFSVSFDETRQDEHSVPLQIMREVSSAKLNPTSVLNHCCELSGSQPVERVVTSIQPTPNECPIECRVRDVLRGVYARTMNRSSDAGCVKKMCRMTRALFFEKHQ